MAMALPKMGGKKCDSKSGESKKKVLRSQYFHNKSHVISYFSSNLNLTLILFF